MCKFRNAAYEKVQLDLLQSFFKIKLKVISQLSTVDKFSQQVLFNYENINRKKTYHPRAHKVSEV